MIYEELYDDFKGLFPEDNEFFTRLEEETGADNECGMHVVFGMVVSPYLIKLAGENPQKAQKAFDFVEQMETCGDEKIANVAEVSVLEVIMTDENGGMKKLGEFLGNESRKTVEHLAHYFKIDCIRKVGG